MADHLQTQIGRRLKALRTRHRLTQQHVSDRLGFKDRQTLAAIEAGERRVSPAELVAAAEMFGVEPEHFTDAFQLAGEGAFSFRARGVDPAVLDDFEARAGRWVATYRELRAQAGVTPSRLARKLDLSPHSSYEDAQACAEELRQRWSLGDVPGAELEVALEREMQVLVLYIDAPNGISGAASRLPGLSTILVNRAEPVGRRSYDLGHELFHVLTWDAMPPPRVDGEIKRTKGMRVEQLAENFAAALLMPASTLAARWAGRGGADVHDWLNATASVLRVTSVALKWRMHNLGHLDAAQVRDELLARNTAREPLPRLFSAEFVTRVHAAVEAGRLSLRRAARLLDLDPAGFADLCRSYGLVLSYSV
ncbi:MAG TPA: XRE family transcriptional regulator [Longimicrobium sp.]|nr:XRE family transcriptional regulator [Longimicrobium sp.]